VDVSLFRTIHCNGDSVEFYFSKTRDLKAAKRFVGKVLDRHGRPEQTTIDGSQTNRMAIMQCDAENRLWQAGGPIAIRSSKYMNNSIEKVQCRVKGRLQSMLESESEAAASNTLVGVKLLHMMQKQQDNLVSTAPLSPTHQFIALIA